MCVWKNEKGLTLIETLLALLFLVMIVSAIPLWIHVMGYSEDKKALHPMEVQLFFEQAAKDIQSAASAEKAGTTLILHKYNGNRVTFKIQKGVLRRIQGEFNDRMLRRVRNIHFYKIPRGIEIKVTGRRGKSYERTFLLYAPKGK